MYNSEEIEESSKGKENIVKVPYTNIIGRNCD